MSDLPLIAGLDRELLTSLAEIAVGIGALAVALVALYIANLKRAEIHLVLLDRTRLRLRGFGWTGWQAQFTSLELPLFAYNSGARGGLLVGLEAVTESGLFEVDLRPAATKVDDVLLLPVTFEAGGVRKILVSGHVKPVGMTSPAGTERWLMEFLERMRSTPSVRLTLSWTYLKGYSRVRRGHPLSRRSTAAWDLDVSYLVPAVEERIAELRSKEYPSDGR